MSDWIGFTIPAGWGIQPDEWEAPWSDKTWWSGDLRSPVRAEHGGRVVAVQFRTPPETARPEGNVNRRFLAQCWCGRAVTEVEPEVIQAGDTVVCDYYRCAQIAAMSPAKRVKFRPHGRALRRDARTAPVVETGIDTPLTPPSPSVRGNPAGEHAGSGRSVGAGLGARDQVPRLPAPGAQHPQL